ncbi:MAG: hypothetical protein IT425_01065 [Pirellulales bacterium]|nr:hypothetical protein [Pirellulales bacterium]
MMGRHRRRGRRCQFEALEPRQMLAGDVTASIVHGDLIVQGDDLANGITISAGANAGEIVVKGIDAGGSATSINGTANGSVTLSGFTDDIKVFLEEGDDLLTITGITVPDDFIIRGHDGNDTITIKDVDVGDSLRVNLGKGDDKLSLESVDVAGNALLRGRRGDDSISIKDSTFENLRTFLGKGDDTLDISGTTVAEKTRIRGGRGEDSFTEGEGNSLGDVSAKKIEENDPVGSETDLTLAISGASTVNENALYTLNLTATGADAASITKWTITWGDGSAAQVVNGNPSSVTHTFADGANTRTISATATNEDGTFNAGNTVAVTVNDVAPSLAISGASSVNEGSPYTLNLSATDPGADTISQWTITWGDGSAAQVVSGNPSSVTHTFADGANTRTISATATNEDGTFNAPSNVVVTVHDVTPTGTISGNSTVQAGTLYTLNLSATDPGADTISQWSINWGDGSAPQAVSGNPSSVTHTYATGPNNYTINATVTNEDGTFAAGNTVAVSVTAAPGPTLAISGASSVSEGTLYTLNLSASGTGADTITQWTINWGDGSAAQVESGNPTSVTHTFADGANTRTVSATATNPNGTFNAGNTVAVTVNDVSPTLALSGASTVAEGSLYTLNLSATDPGADTITQWTINWGDGSAAQVVSGNPTSVTHSFADGPINATISATATNEDGTFSAGNTVIVAVTNVAPTMAITGPTTVTEGETNNWTLGTVTDPGNDQVTHYNVRWGDGSSQIFTASEMTALSRVISHAYANGPNTYTIFIDLLDDDDVFESVASITVTVNDAPV